MALRPPDVHVVSRRTGALVAFAIAAVAAAIAALISMEPLLFLGIPVATLMGYVLAPSVRTPGANVGVAVQLSITTVFLGDAVVVLGLIVGNLPDLGSIGASPATLLAGSAYFWFIGLLLYGLPALAFVTGPCAIVWVMLVTRLSTRSADNEAR